MPAHIRSAAWIQLLTVALLSIAPPGDAAELLVRLTPDVSRGAPVPVTERLLAGAPDAWRASIRAMSATPLLTAGARPAPHPARDRLARTLLLRLDDIAAADVAEWLRSRPDIELCVENRTIPIGPAPGAGAPAPGRAATGGGEGPDPRRAEQWYLDQIGADEAWQSTRGARDVIIAVIDTGIADHVDLAGQLWQNDDLPGNASTADDLVDQDGDGEVAEWERLDDDDNGYVDDVYGWDFVDAPRIGGTDDPVGRDNDPSDGSGHGTVVSGVIGAAADNGIGIAGLCPECSLMPLRAGLNPGLGFLAGVLEEDDAAAAIVYAAENGADVINMSWGDTLFSPIIADAIEYARDLDVVLVASAGNGRFDGPHYPSALPGVLSVGASDRIDVPTSFSNFGPTMDLLAPGNDILSTFALQEYIAVPGTSFSAPLVAATAGLLRALRPERPAAEVAALLTGTADDLQQSGYDLRTGHGRLNARRAVQGDRQASVRIDEPRTGAGADQSVPVRITAEGLGLEWYELSWGAGREPATFEPLVFERDRQIVDTEVVTWSTSSLAAGDYTLRLRARDRFDGDLEERVLVRVDHTRPDIEGISIEPLWDADELVTFVFFDTDDISRATMSVTDGLGTLLQSATGSFITRNHALRVATDVPVSPVRLELAAQNPAGLVGPSPPTSFDIELTRRRARDYMLTDVVAALPPGELLRDVVDLDADGSVDVALMEEIEDVIYGPAHLYTFEGDGYLRAATLPRGLLPRGAADTDGDGLAEVVGIGAPVAGGVASFLFESSVAGGYPDRLAWADSTRAGFVTGFAELDGRSAILAIRGDTLVAYRETGTAAAWIPEYAPNFTGRASLGTTFAALDLDGDGVTEVATGDNDGNLLVYANQGGVLTPRTSLFLGAAEPVRVAAGDVDDDGRLEIVTLQQLGLGLVSEALFERRRHIVSILELEQGALRLDARFGVAGIEPGRNGLAVVDLDGDAAAEILLSASPDLYVFDFDPVATPAAWIAATYRFGVQSRDLAIGDLDGDGRQEVLARWDDGGGEQTRVFEANDVSAQSLVPDGLRARTVEAGGVELSWNPIGSGYAYRVHRNVGGPPDCTAPPLAETAATSFVDTTRGDAATVWYRVQSVETASMQVSDCSAALAVDAAAIPRVLGVDVIHTRALRVRYSEPMGPSAGRLESYALAGLDAQPVSLSTALQQTGGRSVFLALAEPFHASTTLRLTLRGLLSAAGQPVSVPAPIDVPIPADAVPAPVLAIQSASVAGNIVQLELTEEPALPRGEEAAAYDVELAGRMIESIAIDGATVELRLDGAGLPAGTYAVGLAPDLVGVDGAMVERGAGDRVQVIVAGTAVYPNPWRADRTVADGVTFAGLVPRSIVLVVDATGRSVARVESNARGEARLTVRDRDDLASGVYVYVAETPGGRIRGTLAIVR